MNGQNIDRKIQYGEENLKLILEEILKQEFMKIFSNKKEGVLQI